MSGIPVEILPIFGIFIAIFVLIKIGKVAVARHIAKRSGMNANVATAMSVMADDGLEATYLASSLRQPTQDEPDARSVRDRLEELETLKRDGLISASEYSQRRAAILDEI